MYITVFLYRQIISMLNMCALYASSSFLAVVVSVLVFKDKNTSVEYGNLVTANRFIALEMPPKKRKKTLSFASNEMVPKAAQKHQSSSTRSTERNLNTAKALLEEAYTKTLEAHVKSKSKELNNLHNEIKHAAAWVLAYR